MKLVQLTIGSILLIEALLLLYSPQQNYNLHTFVQLIKDQYSDCQYMEKLSFTCIQSLRFFITAFMITGAVSLIFGTNILVGLLAQLIWTVTQSQSYYSFGFRQTKNTLIQIILVIVLTSQAYIKYCREYRKRHAKRQQRGQEVQNYSTKTQVSQKQGLIRQAQLSELPKPPKQTQIQNKGSSPQSKKSKKKKNN